jgi:hypothetical protein
MVNAFLCNQAAGNMAASRREMHERSPRISLCTSVKGVGSPAKATALS